MNERWRRYLRCFGPDVDADVDDELRFHLDMRARLSTSAARNASRPDDRATRRLRHL